MELRKNGYSYNEILKEVKVHKRDILRIGRNTKFSKVGKQRYFKEVKGVIKPIKRQSKKLSKSKTRIIGNLLFDGSVCIVRKYSYVISYVNASKRLVQDLSKDLENVYGISPFNYDEEGKTLTYYRLICKSKRLYAALLRYTPSYSTSNPYSKIPDEVMSSSKRIKLEFLRTFWNNEGSISKEGVLRGYSNSVKVIEQLKKLHQELGFKTKIYLDKSKDKVCYILRLSKSLENTQKFYDNKLFTKSIVTKGDFKGRYKINVVKIWIVKLKNHKMSNLNYERP